VAAHQALPAHERTSEVLKDLGSLHTGIKTSAKFRKRKAKASGALWMG
jgi:hypothetical protein